MAQQTKSEQLSGVAGWWRSLPLTQMTARPGYIWYVVATVCVGAFMAALDASIVNVALPTMMRDFHTDYGTVEWVLIAYLLTLTALLTLIGRLADMVGRRPLYTFGFLVFIAGSALCGAAVDMPMLIISRVFQATGAAMLQANSVAIITATVPAEVRGRAIGLQGSAQAIGLSLGPAVGGALIALFGWRAIFYVNVPVGLIGTLMGALILPRDRLGHTRPTFDWGGSLLLAPALVALMMALSEGKHWGWGSPLVVGLLVLSAVFLAAFVLRELRARSPLVDPRLFRIPVFTIGNFTGLLSYLVMFGVLFLMPFYLEHVQGYAPAVTGLLLTPVPLGMTVAAPIAGGLADKFGPRLLTTAGMVLSALGVVGLALTLGVGAGVPLLIGELALVGIGLGTFTPPNNSSVMGSVPAARLGVAGGILNMARSLGMAMGTAVAGAVLVAFLPTPETVAGRIIATRAALWGLFLLADLAALISVFRISSSGGNHSLPVQFD